MSELGGREEERERERNLGERELGGNWEGGIKPTNLGLGGVGEWQGVSKLGGGREGSILVLKEVFECET